jgi:uncharacterized protein (DUF2141 family)
MITGLLLLAGALGSSGAACSPGAKGVPLTVEVTGWKDRRGLLRVELYPANDQDFLADDTVLLTAHKPFRRLEESVPTAGPVNLCIMAPTPGPYALVVLHDRDSNRRFGFMSDGIGFGGNPRLGLSRPKAAAVTVQVPAAGGRTRVVLNYRRGFSMRPLARDDGE